MGSLAFCKGFSKLFLAKVSTEHVKSLLNFSEDVSVNNIACKISNTSLYTAQVSCRIRRTGLELFCDVGKM